MKKLLAIIFYWPFRFAPKLRMKAICFLKYLVATHMPTPTLPTLDRRKAATTDGKRVLP